MFHVSFVIVFFFVTFSLLMHYISLTSNVYPHLTLTLQGWSFSDAMFVTKKNMADAVASVSKQLDDLSDTLAVNKYFFETFLCFICYLWFLTRCIFLRSQQENIFLLS